MSRYVLTTSNNRRFSGSMSSCSSSLNKPEHPLHVIAIAREDVPDVWETHRKQSQAPVCQTYLGSVSKISLRI